MVSRTETDRSGALAEGRVVAVAASPVHGFEKPTRAAIFLMEGLGVEGDAHAGVTVKHRSRVRQDPTQPNLRQVHLIGAELLEALSAEGFPVAPGRLGENVTVAGLDLLSLPRGTRLAIGPSAVVEVTGLRNPCSQIEDFAPGLLARVLDRTADGRLIRKAGIMGVVTSGGRVVPGDDVRVTLPDPPHIALDRV